MTHSYSNVVSSPIGRIRVAFRVALMLALAAFVFSASTASAKAPNALIHHKIQKFHQRPAGMGRDFWITMMSNYWGQNTGNKYLRLYITSPNNTTAYVESQGKKTPLPITAYSVASFLMPEFWEMESSGIVENKAIHVWSNDADLTVYDMSHNNYTTDGSYCIPTIGWGTDYVVAAYGSLFEGFGNYIYDLPSTMAVTADEDNTTVYITPSCDCRQCTGGNYNGDANSTIVVYHAGQTAQFVLNRGQDLELIPIKATGPDGFDMTGTIVHATQPVGVEGGSVCPNIPANFPYCDHVEEQCPPVRSWAVTYMGTSFHQPPGATPGKDYGCYLLVSSQPGQTIYRHDCATGDHVAAVIPDKYGIVWDEEEAGQKYYSNQPFECFEYLNSATYPDGTNGNGDPAEACVNPREEFTRDVVFQTPTSGNPYYNFANITVNKKDETKTLFDGKPINTIPSQCIDDNWEIFTVNEISAGAHRVTGDDSGVGVYIYGYGYDESYAWTGALGTATFNSPDTVAPNVDTIGVCVNAFIHLSDSGLIPPALVDTQSGLSSIRIDSSYNMTYVADIPTLIPGSGQDTSGYGMYVTNPLKEAYLQVEAYDVAGNLTIITSTYKPLLDSISPPINNLGVNIQPGPPNIGYDTLWNYGNVTLNLDQLQLMYGNKGFTIYDSVGGPLDMSPLKAHQYRTIEIKFISQQATQVTDSIMYGNDCDPQTVALIGSGGANDFLVSSQTWTNELEPAPDTGYIKTVQIISLSKDTIMITSGTWPDQVHFKPAMHENGTPYNSFPITLPPAPAKVPFYVAYFPDATSLNVQDKTPGTWKSPQVIDANQNPSPRFDTLKGNGIIAAASIAQDVSVSSNCPPVGTVLSAQITVTSTGKYATTINRVTQSNGSDGNFQALTAELEDGTPWAPETEAQVLPKGQTATITVRYAVPPNLTENVIDTIWAYDDNGSPIPGSPIYVTFNVDYTQYNVQTALDMGPIQFPGPSITQSYTLTNTGNAPLPVNAVTIKNLSKYDAAFTVTTVPPFPTTLPVGGTMQVNITYNDSLSFDPSQSIEVDYDVTACNVLTTTVSVEPFVAGAQLATNPPVQILSCDNYTDTVYVKNLKPSVNNSQFTEDVVDTIVTYTLNDPKNVFSIIDSGAFWNHVGNVTIKGTDINSQVPSTVPLRVLFTPPAIPAPGLDTFTATVTVEVHSNDNTDKTMTIPITGIAGSVEFQTQSVILNQDNTPAANSGVAGNHMLLPATLTEPDMAGQGWTSMTVQSLGVNSVKIIYIIPVRDLLTAGQFQLNNALQQNNWTVISTTETQAGKGQGADTITIIIGGPNALPAGVTSFGNLPFTVDVDGLTEGNVTPVTLDSVVLMDKNGAPFGPCIASVPSSGNFSLVRSCGDTTLRLLMANEGGLINFIGPATPDPVVTGTVTIKYANLQATNLTLAIYDQLGNEVGRPVNNVYHDAGTWQVSYDASKLASGTYTYRLSGISPMKGEKVISGQFAVQH